MLLLICGMLVSYGSVFRLIKLKRECLQETDVRLLLVALAKKEMDLAFQSEHCLDVKQTFLCLCNIGVGTWSSID